MNVCLHSNLSSLKCPLHDFRVPLCLQTRSDVTTDIYATNCNNIISMLFGIISLSCKAI